MDAVHIGAPSYIKCLFHPSQNFRWDPEKHATLPLKLTQVPEKAHIY